MLELFHTVLTSLLLSAGIGCGVGQAVAVEDEPTDPDSGIDVGSLPSHLASPRGQAQTSDDKGDDQPAALPTHTLLAEPACWVGVSIQPAPCFPVEVAFSTAGRSP